jgi:putative protease
LVQLPHVPSDTGGWIDQKYIFSGIECGACNGFGYIDDPEPIENGSQEEQELGEEIGRVLKYYAHPQVAWIELTGEVQIGETVHIKGNTTDFTTVISSIRVDDVGVDKVGFGQQAGIWVPHRVRHNDRIYNV